MISTLLEIDPLAASHRRHFVWRSRNYVAHFRVKSRASAEAINGLHSARHHGADAVVIFVAWTCIRQLGFRMQFECGHGHICRPIDNATDYLAVPTCSQFSRRRSMSSMLRSIHSLASASPMEPRSS